MTETKPENISDIQLKTQMQKPQTRLEELRTLLKNLENHITRLAELSPKAALEIPPLFDEADALANELQALGTNLSSELSLVKTLSAQFTRSRVDFLRKIGGPQALEEARFERKPAEDQWWWYVDHSLAQEKKARTIRLLRIAGLAAALLLAAILVYNRFFAPDPSFRASYGYQQEAENALLEGDWQTALAKVQNALGYTPENPELYILQGVIQEALGQQENARSSFDTALELIEKPELFYNQRALLYLMLGETWRTLEDAQTAIEINPDSAIAYLHQGQAYKQLGEIENSLQSFEKADQLAQQSGNVELQVLIRINLSDVYQQISLPTFEGVEPLATVAP